MCMKNKFSQKYRLLKTQMTIALFLLLVVLVSGFFILGPELTKIAKALDPNNYDKVVGESLTMDNWNNLDNDFIAKSGDTMSGVLNMGSQRITNLGASGGSLDAVNKGEMDTAISAAMGGAIVSDIKDMTGGDLKMICGQTDIFDWDYRFANMDIASVDVDFNSVGFTGTPFVMTSLVGTTQHFDSRGVTSLYGLSSTGLTVHVRYIGSELNFYNNQRAVDWGWYVQWCAIGQK